MSYLSYFERLIVWKFALTGTISIICKKFYNYILFCLWLHWSKLPTETFCFDWHTFRTISVCFLIWVSSLFWKKINLKTLMSSNRLVIGKQKNHLHKILETVFPRRYNFHFTKRPKQYKFDNLFNARLNGSDFG